MLLIGVSCSWQDSYICVQSVSKRCHCSVLAALARPIPWLVFVELLFDEWCMWPYNVTWYHASVERYCLHSHMRLCSPMLTGEGPTIHVWWQFMTTHYNQTKKSQTQLSQSKFHLLIPYHSSNIPLGMVHLVCTWWFIDRHDHCHSVTLVHLVCTWWCVDRYGSFPGTLKIRNVHMRELSHSICAWRLALLWFKCPCMVRAHVMHDDVI